MINLLNENCLIFLKILKGLMQNLIDFLIKSCFYILITISVVFATFYLISGFNEIRHVVVSNKAVSAFDHNPNKIGNDSMYVAQGKEYTKHGEINLSAMIIKVAENVFLCFVPCFTLLGFLTFYKEKGSYQLREIVSGPISTNEAKEEIKLTKSLFISSLISYVLIKIVEEIADDCIPIRLIAYSVFLIMLFLYYFYLNYHVRSDKVE